MALAFEFIFRDASGGTSPGTTGPGGATAQPQAQQRPEVPAPQDSASTPRTAGVVPEADAVERIIERAAPPDQVAAEQVPPADRASEIITRLIESSPVKPDVPTPRPAEKPEPIGDPTRERIEQVAQRAEDRKQPTSRPDVSIDDMWPERQPEPPSAPTAPRQSADIQGLQGVLGALGSATGTPALGAAAGLAAFATPAGAAVAGLGLASALVAGRMAAVSDSAEFSPAVQQAMAQEQVLDVQRKLEAARKYGEQDAAALATYEAVLRAAKESGNQLFRDFFSGDPSVYLGYATLTQVTQALETFAGEFQRQAKPIETPVSEFMRSRRYDYLPDPAPFDSKPSEPIYEFGGGPSTLPPTILSI